VPPGVRFLRARSGKRIAYSIDGKGPLLIFPAWWVSHLERDLDDAGFRGLFSRFADAMTVVRYDRPGVGLSDRGPHTYSLQDEVANLEDLVDALGAERVALFGGSCGSPPAIAYAAAHPERTSHLLLYGAYSCGPRVAADDLQRAIVSLVRANWGLGSKALTDLFAPELSSEERKSLAATQRASAEPDVAAALLGLIYSMDVTQVAPQVRAPTLVLHREGDRAIPFEHGRELAAQIPGARLVPLSGDAHLPWMGDWQSVARAALELLAPSTKSARSEENVFLREGDVWSIAFAGGHCHLKNARGLADLCVLLSHPGEEIFAVQLMEGLEGAAVNAGPADPVLDERARATIRDRVRELEEIISRAEAAGDVSAGERSAEERDALLRQLRAATGLGGRRRSLGDRADRARKAVTGRIRESIEKIRGALPELAHHLDASITTGSACRYAPRNPTRWRT
jgi:pimeloyl-ACP methyl ester carboxylesterase